MRLTQLVVILLLCLAVVGCGANPGAQSQNFSTPAVVNELTQNNTSAANTFPSQSNGNLGANNVSKVNVHSLLYSGATTKVFAHLLLWFGQSNHMNVGYSSTDPSQVQRQITDMVSRGIDGVIVDWYGPNNPVDEAAQLVMHEAEKHPGFSFAIMIDAGAMGNACSGCSPQDALTELLQYVEKNYFGSSAYMIVHGQPVVTNFNVDSQYSVNWQQVGDYGLGYLSSFYDTGLGFAKTETVGATYKGFNDALASWGSGRSMDQQCGQTWLQTFSQVNSLYTQKKQLPYLQLVTWNDYEEGTELESGIDTCFSLEASISGNTLEWKTSGNENTVDHYAVYRSADGKNLTQVTQTQPGVHSVDLCSLPIPAGSYSLFVQAVGKPMLANRMPGPVSYTPACGGSS